MGNMMQESLFNIWTGKILTKYRKNLLKGKRCDPHVNLAMLRNLLEKIMQKNGIKFTD